MRVLVVNAGSSSLKLRLLGDGDRLLGERDLAAGAAGADAEAMDEALGALSRPDVVVHRVVHGGDRYEDAVVVDDEVRRALGALTDLAPLHQPKSLAALDAVRGRLPTVPQVACFDTAFHRTLPPAAREYALPLAWRRRWGIRRFGFHGLSHAYASRRAAELLGTPRDLRLISCHLGAGASLAAVRDGRCLDTTMGFTPLEGLVMATRSGSVDPGLLLWLIEHEDVAPARLAEVLEHESGLLALAGTPDLREILVAAGRGEERARLALDVYLHRLRAGIGAMAAALGGVDAILFTGGVGEHASAIRDAAVDGLDLLGDARVLVVPAREDLEMARQVRALAATGALGGWPVSPA